MFGLMRTAIGTKRTLDNAAREAGGGLAGGEHSELTCRDMLEFATIERAHAFGLGSEP